MPQILIFIIGVGIGVALARIFSVSKNDNENDKGDQGFSKLVSYQLNRQKKKEEAKNSIYKLLESKRKISNNDIENLLNVSDATATNYLQELETEGKIKQKGKRGRSVYYEIK